MMNFRTKIGFSDLQVVLKELGLYAGAIDGAWGAGTASATVTLLRTYADHIRRGPLDAASLPSKGGDDGKIAIIELQKTLLMLGLYTLKVDGVWGNGTMDGINKAVLVYRQKYPVPTYGLAWSKKVSAAFTQKVLNWCAVKGLHPLAPSWLMACMHFETGGTFSPSIQNGAGARAFGLIQFMEGAAKDLGVPLEEIRKMDQLTQLDLVFKYFEFWTRAGKRYTQLEDFYLTIFYPAAVGKKADEVLFDSASPKFLKAYTQNKGFDVNKDGKITVGEICTKIYDTYYKGMDPVNRVQL